MLIVFAVQFNKKKKMKIAIKVISIILCVLSSIATLVVGGMLWWILSQKEKYGEILTPYLIGLVVFLFCLTFILGHFAKKVELASFCAHLAILLLISSGVLTFMPVTTVSTFFGLAEINSGNLFTFTTDKTYNVFKASQIWNWIENQYHKRIAIVIILLVIAVMLAIIANQKRKKSISDN